MFNQQSLTKDSGYDDDDDDNYDDDDKSKIVKKIGHFGIYFSLHFKATLRVTFLLCI